MNNKMDEYSDYAALLDQCDKEVDEIYHYYAQKHNLSDAALWILYAVYDLKNGITQAEICNCWYFSRQTINTALKRLEEQGIIELVLIPGNRKSKGIALTLEGKQMAKRIIKPLRQAENQVFAAFSDEENRMFIEMSQKRCKLLSKLVKKNNFKN